MAREKKVFRKRWLHGIALNHIYGKQGRMNGVELNGDAADGDGARTKLSSVVLSRSMSI